MRKHLFYLSMVLVLTLFSACGGGKKGVFTPTSSGRAYEVLVVVEPGLWDRGCGRMVVAARNAPQGHQCGRRSGRQS